jgi:Zn-dependent peptidase ImmA (M78 family)
MVASVNDKARSEAKGTLHLLLDDRKSSLGLDAQTRVEPEQFFPVDTKRIIQILGWSLEQVSMVGHSASGEPLLAKCVTAEKKIMLLNTLTEEVKRFTLAHEIGHVVLHTDIPECNGGNLPRMLSMLSAAKRKRGVEYSNIEREAEVYARELVMPQKAVRLHFRKLFGVDQFRAGSGFAAKFAPRPNQQHSVNFRSVAEEGTKWRNSSVPSLTEFFGVSARALAGRLIGLNLVY